MRALWLAVVFGLSCAPTWAANIAQCGASGGWAYFPASKLVKERDADTWVQDRISSGRIVLAKGQDGSYDLLYGDVASPINSAKGDGGIIALVGRTSDSITVIVNYANQSFESYAFRNRPDGVQEVLWTSIKYGTLIPTVRAMRAICDFVVVR
jgi:hypothetical protein